MFNKKFITYKFFTKMTLIYKWQLQNNRYTEETYFLEFEHKRNAVKILR